MDDAIAIVIALVPSLILVIITAYYAIQTKALVDETIKTRNSQLAPSLKVRKTIIFYESDDPLDIEISNIGLGPAKNVKGKIKLEPDGEAHEFYTPILYPREKIELRAPFKQTKLLKDASKFRKIVLTADCEDISNSPVKCNDYQDIADIGLYKNDSYERNRTVDVLKDIDRKIDHIASNNDKGFKSVADSIRGIRR